MIQGIGHLGIFVKDLKATLDGLVPLLGCERPEIVELPDKKLSYALLEAGPVQLEIIEDRGGDTPAGRAVAERGDYIHHFCLVSDDLDADLSGIRKKGVEFTAEEPWLGIRGKRVIFSKPETSGGIPVEVSEP